MYLKYISDQKEPDIKHYGYTSQSKSCTQQNTFMETEMMLINNFLF